MSIAGRNFAASPWWWPKTKGWPRHWWRPRPPTVRRPPSLETCAIFFFLLFHLVSLASARPYLVFANKDDIRFVEVSAAKPSPKTTIVVKKLKDVTTLDFFLQKNKVCWSEITLFMIRCSEINPRHRGKVEKETIVDTGLLKPEGLACDWVNDKIYWTDSGTKRIEVSSMPTSTTKDLHRNVLVWEDIVLPRAIAVAPYDGLMFWTDWGSEYPKIERASMDGRQDSRRILVDTDLAWPNGLTLDYEKKLLYWVEAKLKYIAVVDWNGNNRRVLFNGENVLKMPFAISVFRTEFYWTDWNTNSVHYLNMTTTSSTELVEAQKIKLRGKLTPMDIKVFEPMRQDPNGTSPCSIDNGGCSHLCLASDSYQKYACSCPTGIRLITQFECAETNDEVLLLALRNGVRKISLDTPDFSDIVVPILTNEDINENDFSIVAIDYDPVEKWIYWTDQTFGINRVSINGSDMERIVTEEVDHPDGVAVDYYGRNLFWTDTVTNRIEVTRLDGSHRKIIISHDMDEPRDISLDLENGYMYWSDWGKIPRIERAWMDGSHREAIITDDIQWPNGIALDVPDQKIYWCDAKTDRIEVANVDGSNRKVVVSDILPHPFGLSILGEYIYWTDWQENTVERAKKRTGEDRRILVAHLDGLMSLQASITRVPSEVKNQCAVNNGGCSHLCLWTPSGKKCACPNGLELTEPNGLDCFQPDAFLLYTSKGSINRASLLASASNKGYVLSLNGISDASAVDGDFNDQRIYWTDIEDKTISRAFINGTGRQTLVEFGLEFPDGIAIDWMAKNMYWTDTGLNRIEVAKCDDGSSRRVLLWDNLFSPVSIALDPGRGMMFWSTWGATPQIETAGLDGSNRRVFVPDVGKANGLTIDLSTRRLYWTDLDKQNIAYATLDIQGYVKQVVHTVSNKLYGLAVHKDHIYWADWTSKVIESAHKESGLERAIILSDVENVMDLLVFQDNNVNANIVGYNPEDVSNPCAIDNGGCVELCLFNGNKVRCECSSHHQEVNGKCVGPSDFLVFGQKNKISRLVSDTKQVPDLVLPIQGARDIRALSYDSVSKMIYWVDYGSRKHTRVSINRAYDNGTLVKKTRLLSSTDSGDVSSIFMPHDLAIDSFNRLLFWNDEATNVINIHSLDEDEDVASIGHLLPKDEDKPRAIAVHPKKSLIFWVNIGNPVRIERSRMDGQLRRVVIGTQISVPTDICVDADEDYLFWTDIQLNRLERSDLEGRNRKVLVNSGISGPLVLLAVHDQHVYWAVRSSDSISRVHKVTGQDAMEVKSGVMHLSSLISVRSHIPESNPCSEMKCSHMCLIDLKTSEPFCTCPLGTGLVMGADELTCGQPPTCKTDEFTCNSGTVVCIPLQWRCDGQAECSDHSDEVSCPECGNGNFRCRSGQCVKASLICDGIQHCEDSSDELSCCPKGKFQCSVSKECIDETKTCDGVKDCTDGSDESIPQCTSAAELEPLRSDGLNAGSIAIIVVIIIIIIAMCSFAAVYYRRKRSLSQKKAEEETARREALPAPDIVVSNPLIMPDVHTLPLSTSSKRNRAGSSNGLTYDRSHVTGASSSTASSTGLHHGPPPSPTTTVMQRLDQRRLTHHHHHHHHHQQQQPYSHSLNRRPHSKNRGPPSAYRHYRTINQPPPPTPASTDFNDESESNYGVYNGRYNSLANSMVGGGYDSEYYGKPHPPTPRSQYDMSDYGLEDEEDEDILSPSPIPDEESAFFLNPPPPSREPSPAPE